MQSSANRRSRDPDFIVYDGERQQVKLVGAAYFCSFVSIVCNRGVSLWLLIFDWFDWRVILARAIETSEFVIDSLHWFSEARRVVCDMTRPVSRHASGARWTLEQWVIARVSTSDIESISVTMMRYVFYIGDSLSLWIIRMNRRSHSQRGCFWYLGAAVPVIVVEIRRSKTYSH